MTQKTYSAKPTEVERKWYVIDASQATLGRISTEAAKLLTGKGKAMFTHHIDCGDYVVIINASNLQVTGQKMTDKKYYHHTGFPGGIKEASLRDVMAKDPTKALHKSIRGMLPINKLRDERLKRLKIYADADHKHQAQGPVELDLSKGAK